MQCDGVGASVRVVPPPPISLAGGGGGRRGGGPPERHRGPCRFCVRTVHVLKLFVKMIDSWHKVLFYHKRK